MSKKQKRDEWPKHKQGKRCGYELHPDGSIEVAPSYAGRMAQIAENKKVIDELLQATIRACDELMRPIVQQQEALWTEMIDDYGIEIGGNRWQLNHFTGMLTKTLKP